GALAPNTIATIYGDNLSYETRAITTDEMNGVQLPTVLPGTGVRVLVGNVPAFIYFVSPNQVNVLIPNNLRPGRARIQLTRDGRAGPPIDIELLPAAPALFPLDPTTAIATRGDGSLVSWDQPASAGEVIVLYATGLGPTNPNPPYGQVPNQAAPINRIDEFQLVLNGAAIEARRIAYAGVTPGFAGLYQINFYLPDRTPESPEIRIAVGEHVSPSRVYLPVRSSQ
ncbi:MAG: hypothetical protein GY953_41190, partial [bacterium]|nr:hypothetical protein [bacterium]